MYLNEYQIEAQRTAVYRERMERRLWLPYTALGLAGESGEFANLVKKVYRDEHGLVTSERSMTDELGDCLWYVALGARELGHNLDNIARWNLDKLEARYATEEDQGHQDRLRL